MMILTIILMVLSLPVHELGHYEAMRRCGIRVKEVGLLGFPVSFLKSFRYTRNETVWSIHPLILGAFVKPYNNKDIESKSLRDQLYINGSGPLANFIYALVLLAIGTSLHFLIAGSFSKFALSSLLFGGAALTLWVTRRFVTLLLPILTIPLLGLLIYATFGTSPAEAVEYNSEGTVALGVIIYEATTVLSSFSLAALLSIGLGLANLIPLLPLDGGHIFAVILKTWFGEKCGKVFIYVTLPLFAVMILYSYGLDVASIWTWIW